MKQNKIFRSTQTVKSNLNHFQNFRIKLQKKNYIKKYSVKKTIFNTKRDFLRFYNTP